MNDYTNKLPLEYRWLKAHNFNLLMPWYWVTEATRAQCLQKEYNVESNKEIIVFARRQDKDDIAGFEVVDSVIITRGLTVHLTWTNKLERAGYPVARATSSILKWINDVVFDDTKDWISEAELEDIQPKN